MILKEKLNWVTSSPLGQWHNYTSGHEIGKLLISLAYFIIDVNKNERVMKYISCVNIDKGARMQEAWIHRRLSKTCHM